MYVHSRQCLFVPSVAKFSLVKYGEIPFLKIIYVFQHVKNPAWTGKSSCEVVDGMMVSPLSSSRKGREELASPEEE